MSDQGATRVLLRTGDPLRADMLRQLLEGEGIPVSTPGLHHRAMLGMAGGYVDIVLHVPADDLERAQEIVTAYESTPDESEPDAERWDDDDDARDQPPETVDYRHSAAGRRRPPEEPRLKRIAAFCALVLPFGGAHMYVRRFDIAALFAALQLIVFARAASSPALLAVWPMLLGLDYLGASWHCDRIDQRESPRRGRTRRFAPLVAVSLVLVTLLID